MIERYFSSLSDLTTEETDNSPGVLKGYVTKWGVISHDRGGYRDVFRQEAFSNLGVEEPNVVAHIDHNESTYLARTLNKTLTLTPDAVGLRFKLTLPDTSDGRDAAVLAKRGDFNGMSFGYMPDQYKWSRHDEYGMLREHTSGQLVEVSVVFNPAFPKTSVELNALTDPNPEVLADLQRFMGTPNRNHAEILIRLTEMAV